VQGARHRAVAAPQGEEPEYAHRKHLGFCLFSRWSILSWNSISWEFLLE
jgi:hypothetical protein